MKIETQQDGSVCVLSLSGRMAAGDGPLQLREKFKQALSDGQRQFLFDMLDVPWLDSIAIGEVVSCYTRARDRGGVLKLALQGKAYTLFRFHMLDRLFPLFQSLEEARASFTEAPGPAS